MPGVSHRSPSPLCWSQEGEGASCGVGKGRGSTLLLTSVCQGGSSGQSLRAVVGQGGARAAPAQLLRA